MSPTPDPQPESQPQPISLNELSEAYAQVMGVAPEAEGGQPVQPQRPAEPDAAEALPRPIADQPADFRDQPQRSADEEDPCPICPRTILEAMLFVGNRDSRPLSAARAAELMRDVEPEEIPALVEDLNRRYAAAGCPYQVTNDGSGYRLTLHQAFDALRNRFYGHVREARLSQTAVDVLAVVAYRQPLCAEEISRLRDKPSGRVLSQLVRRGLLRIERVRREGRKRPVAQYLTTDRFLKLFGLETLDDLPQSEDLDRQ